MDIVFENNPRKKIPRETMDKWLNERGIRREKEKNEITGTEGSDSYPSLSEKAKHEQYA